MNNFISRLNRQPSYLRLHTLRWLPAYLTDEGRTNYLQQLLTNIDFINCKVDAFGPQPILEDYDLALESDRVALTNNLHNYLIMMQDAIRLSSNALAEDAQQTYAQLYARLFNHDAFREVLNTYKPSRPWLRILSDTMVSSGGPLIRTLVGHTNVLGCALSEDGKVALSVSEDHTMRIWNLDTGQSQVLLGHTGPVSDCSLSADASLALSSSHDQTLRLWEINEKGVYCRHTLTGHTDRVVDCTLSEDGRLALSASHDQTLRVWDTNTGECIWTFVGHNDRVTCCALSSSGRFALSGSLDTTLRLWDTKTGECLSIMDDCFGAIISCDLSGDGCLALSACSTLLIGDEEPDDIPESILIPMKAYYLSSDVEKDTPDLTDPIDVAQDDSWENITAYLNSIPNLQQILTEERILRLWDTRTGECIRIIREHDDAVLHCVLSRDAQYALSTAVDGSMRIWNIRTSECLSVLEESGMHVSACTLNKNKNLALSAPYTGNLRLWNLQKAIETQESHRSMVNRSAFIRGRFSQDNKYAISCSLDSVIQIWDAQTGISQATIDITDREIVDEFDVSVDSKIALITIDYVLKKNKDIRVIDLNSGQTMHTLTGHTSGITDCAISLDGRIGISASIDTTLRVWDIINGRLLRVMEGHEGRVESCALSWDGQIAVSTSEDTTLRIWNTIEGKCLHILESHAEKIICCRLSGNGLRVLSVSEDHTLRMWDTRTGQCLGTLDIPPETVGWCALDAKGWLGVYMPSPQKLQLIDFNTWQKVVSFTFDVNIRAPVFAPNGLSIMVGDMSGQVYFLQLENIKQTFQTSA